MNFVKKFLLYTVIIAVLAAVSLFVNELMSLNYKDENPRAAQNQGVSPVVGTGDFVRPGDERDGPMSAPELAWLMRERIALDAMVDIVTDGRALETYNDRVRDYNRLAVAIQYRESDMRSAERLVESMKGDIASAAADEAMALSMPGDVKQDVRAATVWHVQKYLKLLRYYPGETNGRENEGTIAAVRMYQVRSDIPETGLVDEELAQTLRELWIARKIPKNVGFN
ncbi:MAG: peptidoglycan-binding protein [Synergistaceae bacterium]|jgi:type III secretion system FlhB-like substrate exporter|nr:peptidoglycan-binding protein [Synergistaceae bacterium]